MPLLSNSCRRQPRRQHCHHRRCRRAREPGRGVALAQQPTMRHPGAAGPLGPPSARQRLCSTGQRDAGASPKATCIKSRQRRCERMACEAAGMLRAWRGHAGDVCAGKVRRRSGGRGRCRPAPAAARTPARPGVCLACRREAPGARRCLALLLPSLLSVTCTSSQRTAQERAVLRRQDASLGKQGARHVREVFAPKASGAGQLAECATAWPVAASVLFSSVAGLLGSGGQANYAAANAVIDAWAATQNLQVPQPLPCHAAVSGNTAAHLTHTPNTT